MLFVVYFTEILISEDYDKNVEKVCIVSDVCNNVCFRRCHVTIVMSFTYLTIIKVVCRQKLDGDDCDCDVSRLTYQIHQ